MDENSDIAFFLPSAYGGGAERVITTVASELSSRGYSVDLLLGETDGSDADLPSEITVLGFDHSRLSVALPSLINYLQTQHPSVIVSTIYLSNILVMMSHFLTRSNSRLVLRVANTPSIHLSSNSARHVIGRNLLPFVYSRADRILAISNGVKADLVDEFSVSSEKITTIYNPIELSMVDERANEPLTHRWLSNSYQTIVGLGRLTPQKDFSTLLQSFAAVHAGTPSARLLILGDGELRESLQALAASLGISDVVEFTGYVDNPYKYLSRADLFVLSSKWEGFGLCIIEALACGCPVVSTDCPNGPREILVDGEYGRLVPVGDVERLSAMIETELTKEHDETKLRSRAEMFRVDRIVDEYESLLFDSDRITAQHTDS
ncbi:glycosyltransferase involved in cell wall biosynthesis [Halohasta litchfieldiae]|uniref:Glycosyltransferase involved in cell wall bisynthesis n=1 Tax=Halohasta litchfieldiae TaxID=1073996 RepID=A0A1H6XWV1_9EURY|nr:glycosyltransferase [Halohasta litchfieldiae]ATW89148.1 glycosyltransferase involved in cell wall biosynthesis [Halohasta litchfieldiae]SEJ29320.1 Glycosyltransferase involved in cell wall bisynthesis [Halohasta litchfieldiae]